MTTTNDSAATTTTVALTPTQQAVLAAACARPDRLLLPLPAGLGLKGGAAAKVIAGLQRRDLIEETAVAGEWQASDAAFAALGISQPEATTEGEDEVCSRAVSTGHVAEGSAALTARPLRAGTKQALLISMLERQDGASLAEIMAATGWQSHTVRGAIAGALKKRLGLAVASERVEGRGRVWKIG